MVVITDCDLEVGITMWHTDLIREPADRLSYPHPLIVKIPPSAGNSDQHQMFLPPKEQIVTSYW